MYTKPFHIISVSDKRAENVAKLADVIGNPIVGVHDLGTPANEPKAIKAFNSSSAADVREFRKLYPHFDLDQYLATPIYPTNPERRAGEIGCWMSHYHAWNVLANSDWDSLLSVEDDAYLGDSVDDRGIVSFIQGLTNTNFALLMLGNWTEVVFVSKEMAKLMVQSAFEEGFKRAPVDEYLMLHVRLTGMTGLPCGKMPVARQLVEKYESEIHNSGESIGVNDGE